MYISRAQEKSREEKRKGAPHVCWHWDSQSHNWLILHLSIATRQGRIDFLKSSLTCKPWRPNDSIKAVSVSRDNSTCCSDDSVTEQEKETDVEEALTQMELGLDGSVCAICTKSYEPGQPVYESNNPVCKVCMGFSELRPIKGVFYRVSNRKFAHIPCIASMSCRVFRPLA